MLRFISNNPLQALSLKSALYLSLFWYSAVFSVVYFSSAWASSPVSVGTFTCTLKDGGAFLSGVHSALQVGQLARSEIGQTLLAVNFLLIWAFLYFCSRNTQHFQAQGEPEKTVTDNLPSQPADDMKEQLLSNLGHEVRTPVAAVCSYLDLIQRAPPTQLPTLIQNARYSAQHLMDVTQNILDAAKIQAQKLSLEEEEVSLRELLVEISSIANTMIERKNLDFYIAIHPDTPDAIRSDPLRIKQILLNLLSNAVKFTHEGHVALLVNAQLCDKDVVFLSLSVVDTGIGIQPDQQDRLFKCFSQVDGQKTRIHGGTGLGLFISRQLADLMKGSLNYEPATHLGSRFTLRIPVTLTSLGDVCHDPRNPDRLLVLVSSRSEEYEYLKVSLESEYREMRWVSDSVSLLRDVCQSSELIDVLVGKCNPQLQNSISVISGDGVRKVGLVSALGQGHEIARMLQMGIPRHAIRPGLPADILNAFDSGVDEPSTVASVSMSPESQALRGKRILLAEDTEMLREASSAHLESYGAEVDSVPNGAEAVRFALNPARRYDLVLMDIQMPVMDGNHACKLIRDHISQAVLPIYALTSHCSWGEIKLSLDAGMNGHMQKPLQIREILKICGAAIASSQDSDHELLNWAVGLANFSGNTTVYSRTLLIFRQQLDELLIRGRAMNWSDAISSGAYLHKCKGMALTAGATQMASRARLLQTLLDSGQVLGNEAELFLKCLKDTRIFLNDLNAIREAGAADEVVDTRG